MPWLVSRVLPSAPSTGVSKLGQPVPLSNLVAPSNSAAPRLIQHMRQDKKRTSDGLPFILARGPGDSFLAKDVSLKAVETFLAADLSVEPAARKAA